MVVILTVFQKKKEKKRNIQFKCHQSHQIQRGKAELKKKKNTLMTEIFPFS